MTTTFWSVAIISVRTFLSWHLVGLDYVASFLIIFRFVLTDFYMLYESMALPYTIVPKILLRLWLEWWVTVTCKKNMNGQFKIRMPKFHLGFEFNCKNCTIHSGKFANSYCVSWFVVLLLKYSKCKLQVHGLKITNWRNIL